MDSEANGEYLSPDQSKKLFTFGIVAAVVSTVATTPLALDNAVTNGIIRGIQFVSRLLTEAIFGVLGTLFVIGTREFLFFAPPGQIPQLRAVWGDFLPLFWAVLTVAGLAFFLGMQLFPEKEEADIYRFMERTFVAVIALIVAGPLFTFDMEINGTVIHTDLFSITVEVINVVGREIMPSWYGLNFMTDNVNIIMGSAASIISAGGAIGAVVIGWKFAIGILLVVGLFYVVLAMRMVLVYTVYAMMPLLLALWIVDIGPMKYGKMVASMVFKLTGVLLLLGIVIAGILATTGAIAGGYSEEQGEGGHNELRFTDQYEDTDSSDHERITDEDDEDSSDDGASAATDAYTSWGGVAMIGLQIFAWFGGIVLSIAITTSALGMVVSMRGGSGTKSRMRQGRSGDAPSGPQVFGGGGSSGGGSGTGSDETVVTSDGDVTHIDPGSADESYTVDQDGNVATHAPENPDEGADAVPLSEKFDYLTGKYGGGAKNVGKAAGDTVEHMTGVDVNSSVSDTVSGMSTAVQQYKQATPDSAKKIGGLMKRGGKAYWNVAKQPTTAEGLGEAARIARESPIGKPTEPDGETDDDTVDPEEAEFDWGPETVSRDAEGYESPPDKDEEEDKEEEQRERSERENTEDKETASVGDVLNNFGEYEDEDKTFDMERVKFEEEHSSEYENDGETKEMQAGQLVDPETGESIEHVGFGTDGDTPALEDGEMYDIENAETHVYNYDKYNGSRSHQGNTGDYGQVKLDGSSEVTKVEDAEETSNTDQDTTDIESLNDEEMREQLENMEFSDGDKSEGHSEDDGRQVDGELQDQLDNLQLSTTKTGDENSEGSGSDTTDSSSEYGDERPSDEDLDQEISLEDIFPDKHFEDDES